MIKEKIRDIDSKKLPSEEKKHLGFYDPSVYSAEIPNMSEYDFLLERNKNHMNEVAITFMGQKITYEELHTKIDEYARALYKKGVRQGDIVALGVANTPEAIYLSYSLNKLGAITSPINPTYNSYKMSRDIEIIKPKMFIGINDCYRRFKQAGKGMDIEMITFPAVQSIDSKKIHFMYNAKQLISGNLTLNPNKSLKKVIEIGKNFQSVQFGEYSSGQLNEIMFTGGSSGVHKGVDLDGNGLNAVVRALDYVLCLEPGEIFLGNLPQFMAFGKMALHYALCKSLNIELTLKALPNDFVDELKRVHPAGVMGGPVHWETLINGNLSRDDLIDLRMPISGGEQLKYEKEQQINEALYNAGCNSTLWNGLGMTEMWAPVSVKRGNINSDTTIGTMIPFTNAKIVDVNTGDELGYGNVGMLHVSGPGMMLGYHNNTSETTKSIYADQSGIRWFVTGDLCKIEPNGELKYVGRLKRCFVCGCDNIYPEQIENILCDFPEIREAIVTKIPDDKFQFLPKYHISLYDENCDVSQLERKIEKIISTTLGDSALPKFYEYHMTPLPRTPNGKIDPKGLQEKDLENSKARVLKK